MAAERWRSQWCLLAARSKRIQDTRKFLTAINIYRRAYDGMRVYQLRYVPGELRRTGV